ncbi:hypothetical protein CANARDRAFT_187175, partial [[Candida] arabinofermentans NRRL YB-2248]
TFITLHSICLILNIPTIIFHLHSKNIPAISLIIYLELMMIKGLVDSCVWGSDNYQIVWDGKIWCDIMIRIQMGSGIGCLTSIFCISLNLLIILLSNKITEFWFDHLKLKTIFEISCVLIFPLIIMGVIYFAQDVRYSIFKFSGCRFVMSNDNVSILVFYFWILWWCLLSIITSFITLFIFFKKRKLAKNILQCTNSGLSISKFSKLLIFCFLVEFGLLPISLLMILNAAPQLSGLFYDDSIYPKFFWNNILRYPHNSSQDLDTWVYIAVSLISFLLFGLGDDALKLY